MPLSKLNLWVSVAALVIGPLTLIVTTVVQWTLTPVGANPGAADVAAQFPAAWTTIGLLAVFGPVIWIAGLPALVTLVPKRGSICTGIGALITGLGLAAGVGHLALFFGLYGALGASGIGTEAAHRVDAASDADPVATALLIVFLIAFAVGPIVLTVGLRVAGIVGVWVPIAALVTAVASFLGGPIAGSVQLLTLVLAWAPLVVALLRPRGAATASAVSAEPAAG